MTPLEFRREMAVYHECERERAEALITQAWHTVAIEGEMRAGRLLKLSDAIQKFAPRPQPEQLNVNTGAQVASVLKRLGFAPKPMSEETRAAMWKPPVPVKMDG